jgi:hypothetical protein
MYGMFGGRWLWRTIFAVSVLYGAVWASSTFMTKAGTSWFGLFAAICIGALVVGYLVFKLLTSD